MLSLIESFGTIVNTIVLFIVVVLFVATIINQIIELIKNK
jgi:hypothetical protein